MKKIILLAGIFLSSFGTIYSQQSQELIYIDWYLFEIIKGNEYYNIQAYHEGEGMAYLPLNFEQVDGGYEMQTSVCNTGFGLVEFNDANGTFSFPEGFFVTLLKCSESPFFEIDQLYFNDFYLANANESFEYDVVYLGNQPNLFVRISYDHYVVYSVDYASVPSFPAESIKAFPNPAQSFVNLMFDKELEQVVYTIFDPQGKSVVKGTFSGKETRLSLEGLPSGLYYVQCSINGYTPAILRVIKE